MDRTLNEASKNPSLLPLTPGVLAPEELAAYEQEFSLVFSDPALRNIALTGATGSGKSTVMNSWRSAHPDHGWLEVSLANFAPAHARPEPAAIEEALVNQIVGKMDLRRSPRSRFSQSQARPWTTDLAYALVGAAFIGLSIFLGWALSLIPSMRPPAFLIALGAVAWFACIVFAIYRVNRTGAIGRLVQKLKPEGEGAEHAAPDDALPLQRSMADLVYLLNSSEYDTVIFDDLDSFGYLPLFQQLRQLCDLANARRDATRAPLRFFYLVNDGTFADPHDRAKFFDYIITVIPYVDPSNALALFSQGLEGVGIQADEEFLYELSLFIDDARILRDLVNEAHHYKAVLFGDAPMQAGDTERMVALVAYKTLFPRDFELLQVDQGYVNALLRSRSKVVEALTAENAREVQALAAAIPDAEGEEADALKARAQELEELNVEYSRKTLAQLLSGMENPDAVFARPPYQHGLEPGYLSEVVASPHFPLIKFLVMRGWIDDTHERFMSNFYSDAVSARDREFLMGIFQGKALDSAYEVENPSAVLGRLDADTLSWSNAKNYSLLTYLLHHGPAEKLAAVFAGIRHDKSLEWLVAYTESDQFDGAVFAQMESHLPRSTESVLGDGSLDVERRRAFAHRILAFGRDALATDAACRAIREFAHADLGFLKVEAAEPLEVAEGLDAISYHPENIDAEGVSKKLLQYVFEHQLFEPTAPFLDNLSAALIGASPALDSGYLVTRLYNLGDTPLKDVVEANADTFVRTLLESTERNLTESGDAVAWLLNCPGISPATAEAYIAAIGETTQVEDVHTVANPTFQAALLDSGRVTPTSRNILDYFSSAGNAVDEHLGALLEANLFPKDLTMAFVEAHLGDESGFLTSVISSAYISDEKLSEILGTYRAQFNHFGVEGLADSRMELLIRAGVVRPTAANLDFVRQANPHCAQFFAVADPRAYLSLVMEVPAEDGDGAREGAQPPCEFIEAEAIEIFGNPDVDERAKLALLSNIPGKVRMQPLYPNSLNTAIATDHFDERDTDIMPVLYLDGDRKLKRALAEAFVEQEVGKRAGGMMLSMDMVADVAWRMRNERASMLAFIAGQLTDRSPEPTRLEVRTVFERANIREYVELMDGPSAIITDTPEDNQLLAALSVLGMAGKQSGKTDWQGKRRINSKGYTRK